MATARYYVGDTRDVVGSLPDGSVDLVLTSSPFLALRSYLPADHPDKAREIGSEATPAEFVDTLLELTAQWRRVLAPHGSIAVELGDTFSGSGGAGGDYAEGGLRDGQARFDGSASKAFGTGAAARPTRSNRGGRGGRASMVDKATGGHHMGGPGWPLSKCLSLIPELYRIGLAYGINPLTGAESPAGRWRVRNVVRWVRPNPPVGALGDKFRPATSEMVVACVAGDRWFDLDAVRTSLKSGNAPGQPGGSITGYRGVTEGGERTPIESHPAGAPPLDWWPIPTHPYTGAHYATWPPKLCEIPIQSMCPREVCRECGQPRRRIVETTYNPNRNTNGPQSIERKHLGGGSAGYSVRADRSSETLGWSDCGHGDFRPGVVLDPFAGTGTTGAVATGMGRDAILVDIDPRNVHLARERIGMFMEEADMEATA